MYAHFGRSQDYAFTVLIDTNDTRGLPRIIIITQVQGRPIEFDRYYYPYTYSFHLVISVKLLIETVIIWYRY
jgi:hypothetical protein